MKKPEQEKPDFETPLMGRLIDVRLKARLRDQSLSAASIDHPDDDAISAFAEGRLADAESLSIISHLVSCATCLHLTADLIRLEPEMTEVGSDSLPDQEPGSLRRFLDRIAEGVTLSNEDAVFAYQENDEAAAEDKVEPEPDPQAGS
jgi:hypothetical protein